MLTIVIISHNSRDYLVKCIASIHSSAENIQYDITVVDNASTDGTIEVLTQNYPEVKLIRNPENRGYAEAINRGVRMCASDIIVISNADVEYEKGSIEALAAYLHKQESVGVVGPQQLYPDRQWQRSFGDIPGIGEGFRNLFGITSLGNALRMRFWRKSRGERRPIEVGYIDGAVMAFRRKAFDSVGGFDEGFFFYAEEADFCLRLRNKGWKVVFLPSALVMHVRGGSSTKTDEINPKYAEMLVESKLKLVVKHSSPVSVKIYCYLQMLHALKMYIAYAVVTAIVGKNYSPGTSRKKGIFMLLVKIWKDRIDSLDVAH